jgi:hypothetical protein
MSRPASLLPVLPEDRFFLLFEGLGAPVTAMWGLLLEGTELERDRWIDAAARTLERHPKASARLVRRSATGLYWEPRPDAARDVCVFHPRTAAPKEPTEAIDALAELMNVPLDSAKGPLLQLHWLPHADGLATLAFRFHHALGDGHGSLALLRDLFGYYNGQEPRLPRPDYSAPAEPLVADSTLSKLRLFARFLGFHFRRSLAYRFAPPTKLFDPRRRPGGRIDAATRVVAQDKTERYLAAARALGATFNELLLAAHGLAIERWLIEQGLRCGTLRIMVNQSLRHKDREPDRVENRSAAFPIWIGRPDRRLGKELVREVHRQAQECQERRIAEAVALLGALLRLPVPLIRWLIVPAATRPRITDSLVVSNMGRLPESDPGVGWFHLGAGRIVAAYPFVRPPDGVGAVSFALTIAGRLCLNWSFLTHLLSRDLVQRLLWHLEAALDELSA